jgi:hypothetical protein
MTMGPSATRELTPLFGNAARAGALAVLANAERPISGYRIAKMTGCQETKVNAVLAKLRAEELVAAVSVGQNRAGWILADPDLRRFIRRRVRISWSEDLLEDRKLNSSGAMETMRRLTELPPVDLSTFESFLPRNAKEFERPAQKDRILTEIGSRPLRRKRTTA